MQAARCVPLDCGNWSHVAIPCWQTGVLICRALIKGVFIVAKVWVQAMWRSALFFLAGAVFSTAAWAQPVTAAAAWLRSTVAGQQTTAAYVELSVSVNVRESVRLLGASTPLAGTTELHQMMMDGGVMKMRRLSFLELPAGKTLALRPGSYHFMLLDLKRPLQPGEHIPLSLYFESSDKRKFSLEVQAEVRGAGVAVQPSSHGHHGHH